MMSRKKGIAMLFVLRNWVGGEYKSAPLGIFARNRAAFPRASARSGRSITGLFFYTLFLAAPMAASAQPAATPNGDGVTAQKTQIITDQDKGTVTIIIDGKPAVMIDRTGLYVMNDMAYGGTLTDSGSGWIKSRIEPGDSPQDSGGGDDGKK